MLNITYEFIENCYLISDTHFYHLKVGQYCGRPYNWEKLIINNWNNTINKNTNVLHLGDFSFGNFEKVKNIREKLNGNIFLIKGNHDRHSKTWYKKLNINVISPFEIKIKNKIFYFSHRPIKNLRKNITNIHGHWHEKCPFIYIGYNSNINFNLSVEVINYTPIKMKYIIKNFIGNNNE